ncbi:MAG TPA: limonene-1,2-epoxide hydrolase family protein [Myxococcota bacterium]|nr:limonene-1,2-epoxide hydrolase family protein [Myxococcota bacterium]
MDANERVIRDFLAAWSRRDAHELAGYFTDDGVYHNMPLAPVAGRAAVEQLIRGFIGGWSEAKFDLVSVASAGQTVIAERVDRIRAGGKSVDLPCVGVFELEGGKIKRWRDYFDLATYQRAMT